MTTVRTVLAVAMISGAVAGAAAEHLTRESRADLIARAQVWMPTDIASKNLLIGPEGPGAFAPFAIVTCDYVGRKLDGNTPKFACLIGPDDEVKVKYGDGNGEVPAEIAGTRLLWALGFGADRMYPVRVVCRGCPAKLGGVSRADGSRLFDPAAIERKMAGAEIEKPIAGWAWPELDSVREEQGGAPRAHREALMLIAAFMQHTDNKPSQQRLLCLDTHAKELASADDCKKPFMMINDLGMTFGRANYLNAGARGSVNLDAWSKLPVWKDPQRCIANLSKSYSGTLADPQVTEAGRAFLADLLSQLSDAQIRDLFTAARVQLRTRVPDSARSGLPTVDEWVAAFNVKRAQIVDNRCVSSSTASVRH